ncbi:MAG: COG4223 family protein [Hyphomicrobiales bacterium]
MSPDQPDDAVKPQVIDLEAEDVTAPGDEPAPEPEPSPASPPPRPRRIYPWLVAAVVVGALGGGYLYRSVLSSYLPSDAMQAMDSRIGGLEAATKTLGQQLNAVSAAADALKSETATFDAAVKQAAADAGAARQAAATLAERTTAVETALNEMKSSLEALKQTPTATSSGSADGSAVAALALRIEALEKDVASLKSAGSGGGGEAVAALSRALSDLKAKIAAGSPYRDEYDRIARMVPAAEGLDVLATHASLGLPGPQGLAAELKELIPSLPKPSAEENTAGEGYWDSFWNTLTSVVKIRDIGGADWPALAENCASLAAAGDLVQAVALIDKAESDKPASLAQWRDRAAARLALETAIEQVAQSVLRQIAATGGGQ